MNINQSNNYNYSSTPNFRAKFDDRFLNSAKNAGEALKETKLVNRVVEVLDQFGENATEISKDWHSTFTITNHKLGDAEIGIDTKVPPALYPGNIHERVLGDVTYFTPENVKEIEGNLFRDYLKRSDLTENPQEALSGLKGKVKESVFRIYERVVKNMQNPKAPSSEFKSAKK